VTDTQATTYGAHMAAKKKKRGQKDQGSPRLSVRVEPELLVRLEEVGQRRFWVIQGNRMKYPIGRSEAARWLILLGLQAHARGEELEEEEE